MAGKKEKSEEEIKKEKTFQEELVTQLTTLATSGFGLVAALAWNEAIQGFVKQYIEPRVPGTGIFYQFLYAIIITCVIVLITYQLSRISAKLQQKRETGSE